MKQGLGLRSSQGLDERRKSSSQAKAILRPSGLLILRTQMDGPKCLQMARISCVARSKSSKATFLGSMPTTPRLRLAPTGTHTEFEFHAALPCCCKATDTEPSTGQELGPGGVWPLPRLHSFQGFQFLRFYRALLKGQT